VNGTITMLMAFQPKAYREVVEALGGGLLDLLETLKRDR
jgi:hypothetical protein